ncbi:hypothetical protein [Halobacillus sp. K22]|uniref:hypothetical protein n=1 Tax=Halobacillus sp. K22 TaxID=3457431 RepID=UPI003FCC8BE5
MDKKNHSEPAFRKPAFVWIIACTLILLLIFNFSSSIDADVFGFLPLVETPEKTVENFFTMIEAGELLEAKQYLHPSIPWDPVSDIGVIPEHRSDVSGDFAVLNVMLEIYPEPLYEQNQGFVSIELERVDGKWLIYGLE